MNRRSLLAALAALPGLAWLKPREQHSARDRAALDALARAFDDAQFDPPPATCIARLERLRVFSLEKYGRGPDRYECSEGFFRRYVDEITCDGNTYVDPYPEYVCAEYYGAPVVVSDECNDDWPVVRAVTQVRTATMSDPRHWYMPS